MSKTATCIIFVLFLVLLSAVATADMLEISDVTVEVDDDKQSADENGGTIDILPDSTLTLKVKVSNLYDSDIEESDIEDIEIEAILEELDDGDDFEETSDDFDLRPGRDKTVTIEFKIPLRLITDETYKMTLTATGEDGNGTSHTDEVEFDVDVDKEKHELRFLRKELTPATVTCNKETTLIVHLINTGEEDEDVEFVVDASSIGYTKRLEFEMVEDIDDDDNEYEFSGTIDLEDVAVGTYSVPIKALYYDGRRTLEDTLTLEVAQCGTSTPAPTPAPTPVPTPAPTPEPTQTPEPTPTTTQPTQTTSSVEVVSQPAPSYIRPSSATAVATPRTTYTEKGWLSENKWLVIILVTDLILIILGIIIITAVLRRRK
ncbi:hypothetical protein KY359_04505 [Candidatus Woesearchaeota archaeon]|nr:hypothetical protein [Candidatus Woesearchaeota archaeon]